MKMISASQALDMLSAHAPRAWAKRVLSSEVYQGNVSLFFGTGEITERQYALEIIRTCCEGKDEGDLSKVRRQYGDEVGDAVARAAPLEKVAVRTDRWTEEARQLPIQVVVFADDADWESGTVTATFDWEMSEAIEGYEELLMEGRLSELQIDLHEMCFLLSEIEMLAPGDNTKLALAFDLFKGSVAAPARTAGPGRRREYDWEGALLYLLGEAEKNGIAPLPDARGAQADIQNLLADWFSANGGKVPADSQLQSFAGKALRAIRSAKP